MAVLSNEVAEGNFQWTTEQDFGEFFKKSQADLDGYIHKSHNLSEGEVVGGVVKFQVADGYAFYKVLGDTPLVLQHIPFGDAYEIPNAYLRGLERGDIEELLERERQLHAMFSRIPENGKELFVNR